MTTWHILEALGGWGLFLFSLRTLTRVLQRTLSRRLRGIFGRALGHPVQCLAAGAASTAVVQASSISIIASMSMVGSTLITLEQGYYLMLGATLGTTLKAWLVSINDLLLGPVLVGVTSVSLLFVKRSSYRDALEGVMAIGLALWGMFFIGQGLTPMLDLPSVQDIIRGNPGQNLMEQTVGVLMGIVFAGCVQSSSTVVGLVITLAAGEHLAYPQAASLILGANIGTTFGPLLASLEYGPNLRRLALAHFFVKVGGVLITLFFFPQFINAVAWLVPNQELVARTITFRLAAVHTVFNLINMIWWSVFSSLILRLVGWLVPARNDVGGLALAPVVRRMLRRSPERSRDEALRQMNQLLVCVKTLLDIGSSVLVGERTNETRLENRILEQREFQGLKDSTYELLVQASAGKADDLRMLLARLADLEELYFQALRLREQLESGMVREKLGMPLRMAALTLTYRRCVDEVWLRILFPKSSPEPSLSPVNLARQWEDAFYASLQEEELTSLQASWAFDLVSNLRSVLLHLAWLSQMRMVIGETGLLDSE
ncbi:Na/Pi cotransporter family protein [bacterium]|nr:Na/Pi cotransporter family protein [bacterium]